MSIVGQVHVAFELWGSLFCVIAAFCIFISDKEKSKENRLFIGMELSNALLIFADSFAWIYKGDMTVTGYYMTRISNFIAFIMGYILMIFFTWYVIRSVNKHSRLLDFLKKFVLVFGIIAILVVVISQFNHMLYYFDQDNVYHRGKYWIVSQLFGIACMIGNWLIIFIDYRYFRRDRWIALILYIVYPAIAIVVQLFIFGYSMLNVGITISLITMFIILEVDQKKKYVEQEQQMSNMKIQIMLSQIQPHFLYNILNTIYNLCEKDPVKAQKAISYFSTYLRGNLDSLNRDEAIPFEQELRFIQNYLSLEKMRFDEELSIVYQIQTISFAVPFLSVQPLVENAVKHGVGKKAGGGTVTIRTSEEEKCYQIMIQDDGVGFDLTEPKKDGRSHIGLDNVRQRLKNMCNGTLEIASHKGTGTIAIIQIPKSKNTRIGGRINEHYSGR